MEDDFGKAREELMLLNHRMSEEGKDEL